MISSVVISIEGSSSLASSFPCLPMIQRNFALSLFLFSSCSRPPGVLQCNVIMLSSVECRDRSAVVNFSGSSCVSVSVSGFNLDGKLIVEVFTG